MSKTFKVMVIVAITALTALPVFAQTTYETLGSLSSNTNVATAGIFKNDVDNFMDYYKYSTVNFDKWFGFITGRNTYTGVLDLGYARSFGGKSGEGEEKGNGGIYLGAWYRGNIYRLGGAGAYETNTIEPTYDNNLEMLLQTTDVTAYNPRWHESANNFEFLIGLIGMGIRVGFYESASANKNEGNRDFTVTDYLDGRKDYTNEVDEYTRSVSYLKPYLGWGMNFAVGKMGIRPWVDFAFLIYENKTVDNYRSYTDINGEKINEEATVGAGQSIGYLRPDATVGAWLDLEKKGSVQTSVGLSYRFITDIYSNSYDNTGLSGDVDGTVTWAAGYVNREAKFPDRTQTTTNITLNINEQTNMQHVINPRYKITGEVEKLKLGFQATLPVTIASSSTNQYSRNIQTTAVEYNTGAMGYKEETETIAYTANGHNETSTLGINLNLYLGASYQLIPNRFGINAGIAATPVRYSHTVATRIPGSVASVSTTKRTQDDGSVTVDEKTVISKNEADQVAATDNWEQYTGTLSGGFTFNFTPNAALDMAVSNGTFGANTFNLALTTVNVILTFKF